MSIEELSNILEEHGIKATANRLLVAKALNDSPHPLSLMELEDVIGSIDKSGISRCLTMFREKRLVHSIEGSPEGTRYEICRSHDAGHDEDAHVHFLCVKCHRTICLEKIPIPLVSLPDGYIMESSSYIIKGICRDCSSNPGGAK